MDSVLARKCYLVDFLGQRKGAILNTDLRWYNCLL